VCQVNSLLLTTLSALKTLAIKCWHNYTGLKTSKEMWEKGDRKHLKILLA
jgi:hypothetical protein